MFYPCVCERCVYEEKMVGRIIDALFEIDGVYCVYWTGDVSSYPYYQFGVQFICNGKEMFLSKSVDFTWFGFKKDEVLIINRVVHSVIKDIEDLYQLLARILDWGEERHGIER